MTHHALEQYLQKNVTYITFNLKLTIHQTLKQYLLKFLLNILILDFLSYRYGKKLERKFFTH